MPRWLLGCFLLLTTTGFADEAIVRVELGSGRSFQGAIDTRTTREQLWLRFRVGRVQLQRPIEWSRIRSAQLNGEPIEIEDLQALVAELTTPAPTDPIRRPSPPDAPTPIEPAPRVATIRCDAWLANWDADAEFDGFLVDIAALDTHERTLDVQGTVQAELIGIDYQPGYLNSSSPGGRVPIELSRWSQPWEKQRRYVKLEYQTRDPQRDGNLSRYAMLKLRLIIPGHGVFEQQLDGLRTRPFTPVGNLLR